MSKPITFFLYQTYYCCCWSLSRYFANNVQILCKYHPKQCLYIVQILYKYIPSIVQLLPKYCPNVIQLLSNNYPIIYIFSQILPKTMSIHCVITVRRFPKCCLNISQIMSRFCPNIIKNNIQTLSKYWINISQILFKFFWILSKYHPDFVQILTKAFSINKTKVESVQLG